MYKSNLKTGDIIVYRNGDERIVMLNALEDGTDVAVGVDGWIKLDDLEENMTAEWNHDIDVMKVYRQPYFMRLNNNTTENAKLIWERTVPEYKYFFSNEKFVEVEGADSLVYNYGWISKIQGKEFKNGAFVGTGYIGKIEWCEKREV